jgi:hypothetical protein
MGNELVRAPRATRTPAISTTGVIDLWLRGRSERTLRAYRFNLTDFARFMGIKDPAENPAPVLELLIAGGPQVAFQDARDYIADMKARGLPNAGNDRVSGAHLRAKRSSKRDPP